MKYILIVLLLLRTLICFPQSDTVKAECDETGIFMLPYFCPSCQVVPDSLPAVLGFRKVTITSTLDSTFSQELDLTYALLDSMVYFHKAEKANCQSYSLVKYGYYDDGGHLIREFWNNNGTSTKARHTLTMYKIGADGKRVSERSYIIKKNGRIRRTGDIARYFFNTNGLLSKIMWRSHFWSIKYKDTTLLFYDSLDRQVMRFYHNDQTSLIASKYKTIYSADGLTSVTRALSDYSEEGSLMDSTFYTPGHKIAKVLRSERSWDDMWAVSYQYDSDGKISSLKSYHTNDPKTIETHYIFHYMGNGLLERIEHYTSQGKGTISYQYEY